MNGYLRKTLSFVLAAALATGVVLTLPKAVFAADVAPTITFVDNSASSTFGVVSSGIQITATGTAPITFSLDGAPAGVSIDPNSGLITIDLTVARGTYPFTIKATNGAGTATKNLTLTISDAPVVPSIISAGTASVESGVGGTFQVIVSGNPASTYALDGTEPAGVSIDPNSGLITIDPTVAQGMHLFTITATNIHSYDTQNFVLTVKATPTVVISPSGISVSASTTELVLTFSEPMDIVNPGTVSFSGTMVDGPVLANDTRWNAANTVLTIPIAALANGTQYSVDVVGFQDVSQDQMTAANGTFTVELSQPPAPPPPPPSGGNYNPPPPPPAAPKTAFPCGGEITGRRINVYKYETLKTTLFRLSKGDEVTLLGIAENGRAFLVEHDSRQGFVGFKDIATTFGVPIKATAIEKGSAYVKQESGKLKRVGYFPKDKDLWVHGISGKYIINKQTYTTYYLDGAQWRLWVPEN